MFSRKEAKPKRHTKALSFYTLTLLYSFVCKYMVYVNCGLMYFSTHILKAWYQRIDVSQFDKFILIPEKTF